MTDCPLGEDCDLTIAYMLGAEKAKDTIKALRANNAKLREALRHYASANNWDELPGENYRRVWLEPYTNTRESYNGYDLARAALGGEG